MFQIISIALSKCKEKYEKLDGLRDLTNHLSVSAIILNDNQISFGVNIPRSGVICAEMVALGAILISNKYSEAKYIVTITKDAKGKYIISNMCGNCRQNLFYICPQIKVVIGDIENYSVIEIKDLLPYPHYRTGNKRRI